MFPPHPRLARASRLRAIIALCILAGTSAVVRGDPQGLSFYGLAPEYAQHVFAVTDNLVLYLGGLVVLQNGDVIAAECAEKNARLHRFAAATTTTVQGTPVHPDAVISPSAGGCGLALHPNGLIYSNTKDTTVGAGVTEIQVTPSGATVLRRFGRLGNALGIAVDPGTTNLFYLDAGCTPNPPSGFTSCGLVEMRTDGTLVRVIPLLSVTFGDGLAIDPSGAFIFVTDRLPRGAQKLLVLDRATGTVLQAVPLPSDPVGMGFSASSPKFLLTNNQNGTMSRLDFPGDNYRLPPTITVFASNGFRGDFISTGPDTCVYVTQLGVRYNNGVSESAPKNSIVQICDGFAPPPGVTPNPPPPPSSLCGAVYNDMNNDGSRGASEPGISGVIVSLSGVDTLGRNVSRSTSTGSDGAYCFNELKAGTYGITEMQPDAYLDGKDTAGSAGGTVGSDAFTDISLAAGVDGRDYGFGDLLESSLSGYVYVDANNDGVRDATDTPIGGVRIALSGTDDRGRSVDMTATTGIDGRYMFSALRPGTYTLTETQPATYADGKDTQGAPGTGTAANDAFVNIELPPGTSGANNNFGEIAAAPAVTLLLKTNGTNNDGGGTGPALIIGATVTWTYDIQNTGNVALSNITVVDDKAGTIGCPATTLAVNASMTCVRTETSTLGQHINMATVTATDPFGTTVTAQNEDRYLGSEYDITPPGCVMTTQIGPPYTVKMTFRDTETGLAALSIDTNVNFNVSFPRFTRGTTGYVTVTGTRIDGATSGQLVIKGVDVAGNAKWCDPVVATVTRLTQNKGKQTFTGIADAEHIVTVVNGSPGLRRLEVVVNGVTFPVKQLDDKEVVVVDIRSAMRVGTNNTITLIPRGKKGESADVTIADQ